MHLGLRNGENGVLNRLTNAAQHLFEGPSGWQCGWVDTPCIAHQQGRNGVDGGYTERGRHRSSVQYGNGRRYESYRRDGFWSVTEPKYVSVIAGTSVVQPVMAAGEAPAGRGEFPYHLRQRTDRNEDRRRRLSGCLP